MAEKSAVTPITRSVQMKKKPPLRVVPKPIPTPLMWMTGTPHQHERREEDDDIPRSPFGEHERSVQPRRR